MLATSNDVDLIISNRLDYWSANRLDMIKLTSFEVELASSSIETCGVYVHLEQIEWLTPNLN